MAPSTTTVSTVMETQPTAVPQSVPSAEQPKGFFSKLFDGAKNMFGKAATTTADIAGKTLQT